MTTSCVSTVVSDAPPVEAPAETGEPVEYLFGTVDGAMVGSAEHRGRVSVLLFITTFDLVSQAQAKRLEDLARLHTPRLNALAIVLEPPRNVDLARTFVSTVELHFPVAMADSATLAGQGPWARVQAVPTWVLLDRTGRIRAAYVGAMTPGELESWVEGAE